MEIEPPTSAYAFVAAMYLNAETPLQRRAQPHRAPSQPNRRHAATSRPLRAGRANAPPPTDRASCRMKVWWDRVMQPDRADQIRVVRSRHVSDD